MPELATISIMGGFSFIIKRSAFDIATYTVNFLANGQENFLNMQIAIEDYFINLAKLTKDRDCIVISDRGFMDSFAYVTPEASDLLLEKTQWNLHQIRDSRYDMVIHMVTAANGAEKFYTLENNKARTEGIPLAIELDNKILNAWNGHPNHV